MCQGTGVGVLPPSQASPALALIAPSDSSPRSLPCLLSWLPPCPCPTGPSVSHPQAGAHPNLLPAGFLEHNGKPYCHQDFLAMFAPKCQGCERPVIDNYLSALQGVWHAECFVCTVSGTAGMHVLGVFPGPRQPSPLLPPGVPNWLQRRLLLRAGGEALLRAALPPAAGQHLPRLRPPRHRALHHGRGAQVPPRALRLLLLPGPAAQGHLLRAWRQDVLPALPRQALCVSPRCPARSLPAWMAGRPDSAQHQRAWHCPC